MATILERVLIHGVESAIAQLGHELGSQRVEVRAASKPEFGDFSTPVCMALAPRLKLDRMALATALAEQLRSQSIPFVKQVTVSPPGFVNFGIDAIAYGLALTTDVLKEETSFGHTSKAAPTKVIIEHTNINSNKAAHAGHLRNACLGDSVARVLRALGNDVEVQNYIDDTGVQVADVVAGFQTLGLTYDGLQPFDYFTSQVYTTMQRRYEVEPALVSERMRVLREIEDRDSSTARFAKRMSERIVTRHLETMARVGVQYDLLTWESDILELGFWQAAFAMLRQRNLLEQPAEGPLAGCWVVPFGEGAVATATGERSSDKVLVKSDGVVTYTGKDIAYQLWKFGLLGRDFAFRLWSTQVDGTPLWSTTTRAGGGEHRSFGHGQRVINVIDVRQAYPQEVVYESLRRLGFVQQADNSTHLSYEVVALSAAAAESLGVAVDDSKHVYAFSGRQGIEVKADDLLNLATERMAAKLAEQENAGRAKSTGVSTAALLAAGAVRYYLLKFGLNQIIPFDFDDALRHTGETGVYLQYAYARACNVLRRTGSPQPAAAPEAILPADKALILCISRFPAVVLDAGEKLAPPLLARYAFELATAFSDFYEHTPALYRETDAALRHFRYQLVDACRQTLHNALQLLGITPLEAI